MIVEQGLLWYLGAAGPQIVPRQRPDLAALLQVRNSLVAALALGAPLPPLLRDARRCGSCFQLRACALLHKVSPPPPPSRGMPVCLHATVAG